MNRITSQGLAVRHGIRDMAWLMDTGDHFESLNALREGGQQKMHVQIAEFLLIFEGRSVLHTHRRP